jgi:probable HAF family extracellular repeat protein
MNRTLTTLRVLLPLTVAVGSPALALPAFVPTVSAVPQRVEYTITRIHPPPNAFGAVATGFNDLGHVVGRSQFFDGSPGLQGWVWKPAEGLTLLPQPPGLSRWSASDINNGGVIAGDGGFDSGQAWRLENGAYVFLGILPGDNVSTAGAINELGKIVGTSRDGGSFLVPPNAFLSESGQPMELVLAGGWAAFVNDSDQVVGHVSNQAWRSTPGSGVEMLGPLPSHPLTWAWAINAHGDVVGEAAWANGNGHVPFLFTDAGGMQQLGNFGGGASAADINAAGVVVGTYDPGVSRAWIWSEQKGMRILNDLVDPAKQISLMAAGRINEAGQILCRAYDNTVPGFRPVVLTPVDNPRHRRHFTGPVDPGGTVDVP